ncbi:substrate-binding domain-containing protein [Arthrobacter sp. NEB 688]|nr:substrate-binding domain-containing protein [Arthrobacter sp. NEB 688]
MATPVPGPVRPRPSSSDYRVALVLPRQGPAGIFGLECLAAAELAAAEIDAAGGVAGRSVRYVHLDAGGDPDVVAGRVGALLAAGEIDAVTGWHLSNLRQSIARVVGGRAPYVYAAAYEGGERGDGVLCSGEVPGDQILASLDWLRTELRLRRWFVVGNDYVWPRESAARTVEGLAGRDVEVLRCRFVPLGTESPEVWGSVLEEIVHSGAEGVITLLVGSDAVRFNRAFAEAGMDASVVRFSPFIDETVVLATGAQATRNLFVSAGWFSSLRTASAEEFARKFRGAWDLVCGAEPLGTSQAPSPGTMAETTYSGVHLLAGIAGRSIPTVHDARRAFSSWAWDSPHGTVELRAGEARHPVHLAVADGVDLDVVARVSTGSR